jgi:PadR family transcriptional regulator, regulatory protein PadR
MGTPPELLQGTVEILVLRVLAWQPMHGYAITRFVRDRSSDELTIEGAALYQALHRMERKRLVRSRWGTSETNRRVRVYDLTAAGRKHLAANSDAWHRYAKAVSRVLAPA